MQALSCLGPWGLLPFAAPAFAMLAKSIADVAFRSERPIARALFGATAAIGFVVLATRAFAAIGVAGPGTILGALVVAALGTSWWARRRTAPAPASLADLVDLVSAPHALVAVAALTTAIVAAYYLPVWHWDSLGYHLPFVDFVLARGSSADVPETAQYLGTYPHAVEWCFTALRAMLPDDRLVDLGQVGFGALGALAVAGIARTLGASRSLALAAGSVWLAMPIVFLQLPTNYVDVASASFFLVAAFALLQPATRATFVAAAIALGLFLGSKPSAPVAVALLAPVLIARIRGVGAATAIGSVLGALALGAESYVVDLVRFGNPVWPVAISLGPLHLPGPRSLSGVLMSGPKAAWLQMPIPLRALVSWTAVDAPAIFDMRLGGFGAAAPVAIVAAIVRVARRRELLLAFLMLAAIATPDPSLTRYVLPLPGLALAAAAASVGALKLEARAAVSWAAAAAAVFGMVRAAPALVGEGPPLRDYPAMSVEERAVAVGADGSPAVILALRDRLAPGDAIAFDEHFEFSHLLFRPDAATRVIFLPPEDPAEAAILRMDREHVRLVVLGDGSPIVAAANARLLPVLRCHSSPCGIYRFE